MNPSDEVAIFGTLIRREFTALAESLYGSFAPTKDGANKHIDEYAIKRVFFNNFILSGFLSI
jgi:hypothetical protein